MKSVYTRIKNKLAFVLKDESAQGMAEYAMLILIVVAIAVIFKEKIKTAITAQMGEVGGKITGFKGE